MTSVSKDQAKFFLEMSNWDLEVSAMPEWNVL
jgi:hypothetical protein